MTHIVTPCTALFRRLADGELVRCVLPTHGNDIAHAFGAERHQDAPAPASGLAVVEALRDATTVKCGRAIGKDERTAGPVDGRRRLSVSSLASRTSLRRTHVREAAWGTSAKGRSRR